MADYWIKWYHEIIDDPKMATLPDRLWRRFSELCLLAGRLCQDKSGMLPDTRQIAWMLRMSSDELQADLDQLHVTGIIQPIPNGWLIVNFSKRQQPATASDRVRQHRERKHKEQYYGDVTDLKRNVTQKQINRLTETETETEQNNNNSPEFGALCNVYEKNIGPLAPMISEKIATDLEEYGLQMCLDAISEALKNNVRKWSYVQGILKNWKLDGRRSNKEAKDQETHAIILPDGQIVEAKS